MSTLTKKEQTHLRILDTAARLIRQQGFEALSVGVLMKESGLTHGGFYAHFVNRDALLAEALAHARCQSAEQIQTELSALVRQGQAPLQAFIELYLSEAHLGAAKQGEGCPLSALGSELFRLTSEGRVIAQDCIEGFVGLLQQLQPSLAKEQAFALFASLMGVVQLTRSMPDPQQAHSYLTASRNQLQQQYL